MSRKLLDLGSEEWDSVANEDDVKVDSISKKDIAIIGMNGRLGNTNRIEDYWKLLINGGDGIVPLPAGRRADIEGYVRSKAGKHAIEFIDAAYLDEIDHFDFSLFGLSPGEASLMDPAQRIFLETAWGVIEDAGYGGKSLSGTRTGVYVGYSNTPTDDYANLIEKEDPESFNKAVPGNLKSIIASRISYLLDLRGPSLMIDTACSSSLVAVHLACRGLRNGDCEYAIAGGVKVSLIPGMKTGSEGMGITSEDGRTRTFDDSSEGTGVGEGVAAVLLKPLDRAIKDRDHIYAVIKGSAINQDGSSVGLTAPNAAAQGDVIIKAWDDAQIDPATISYIEAHGTATRLGDPVEIGGIERAFRQRVDKLQFCAIGSVKTNVGHLDSTAGLAGLIKSVLALKNQMIPPSLHFQTPNRAINFIESPVYINDRLREWSMGNTPRRCGVSSFGLSGTNAHVILEEAPVHRSRPRNETLGPHVLTLSAKSNEGIIQMLREYRELLEARPELDPASVCFTAAVGRGHYSHRLAVVFQGTSELLGKLLQAEVELRSAPANGIYYGSFKMISNFKASKEEHEWTEEELRTWTELACRKLDEHHGDTSGAVLHELCGLYIRGATVDWERLYRGKDVGRLNLPVYPFQKKRCWITRRMKNQRHVSPLLGHCLAESVEVDIYTLSVNTHTHWEIGEHALEDTYLFLGTGYVEMMTQLSKRYFGNGPFELRNVVFASPLFAAEGEDKELQILVKPKDGCLTFTITSRNEASRWVIHSEGQAYPIELPEPNIISPQEIIDRCSTHLPIRPDVYLLGYIKTSPRWHSTRMIYFGNNEALARIELVKEYRDDLERYYLYPSLLDAAANAANSAVLEGAFLPLLYSSLKVFGPTPPSFYSSIRFNEKVKEDQSIASFDICLFDDEGRVFAEIEDYTIKGVNISDIITGAKQRAEPLYYHTNWVQRERLTVKDTDPVRNVLLFNASGESTRRLEETLTERGCCVIGVEWGTDYYKCAENAYTVGRAEDGWLQLSAELKTRSVSQVIFAYIDRERFSRVDKEEEFQELVSRTVDGYFYLVKALLNAKVAGCMEFTVLTDSAYEVGGDGAVLNPLGAGLFGMSKALQQEYGSHIFRAIDADPDTDPQRVAAELMAPKQEHGVSFRDGRRYVEEFVEAQIDGTQAAPAVLHSEGVYVITGGTGGIGLELARYMASRHRVNLALVSRRGMPAREEWECFPDEQLKSRIRVIEDIEARGSHVDCIALDISDYESTRAVLHSLRRKYGRINGIIHSAGVAGDGFLIRREKERFDEVVRPKVQGTWNLDRLTEEDDPDFFVMCSSLTAVFGAPGQSDYTFANAFLDAYASYRSSSRRGTLTVGWPGWSETGMAVAYGINSTRGWFRSMTIAEAVTAFHEVLRPDAGRSRVLIGSIDKEMFAAAQDDMLIGLSRSIQSALKGEEKIRPAASSGESGQELSLVLTGKSTEDLTATEHGIAMAWAKILGMQELDLYDKFLEVGGDSLLATYLLKELNAVFPGAMDITDVFIYSTIFEMAEYIDSKQNQIPVLAAGTKPQTDNELEHLLQKLAKGEISAKEAGQLF